MPPSPLRSAPSLLVVDAGVWGTFLLGVAFRHVICGFYLLFPSQSGCPPRFINFPQTGQCKTPFLGRISVLSSFVSLFIFYILSYLLSKTMGCFSGRLMTSASDQKLFCEVFSVFSCSLDEFVGEKVVSPSCSSAILAPLTQSVQNFCFAGWISSGGIQYSPVTIVNNTVVCKLDISHFQ